MDYLINEASLSSRTLLASSYQDARVTAHTESLQLGLWTRLKGRPSWNKDIQQILTTCDIPELFEQCSWHTCSSDRLVTQVTSELNQLESRQRRMAGAPMLRLRVYNELDTPTSTSASSVIALLSRKQRLLLAKLRSGTLPLALETGRYTQTPAN